ncbi:MAG: sugar transferase [Acidimicrobiales bacterium]
MATLTTSDSTKTHRWKRPFDVVAAAAALTVLSPIILGLAALVRVKLGSPILFRQTRPGLNGEPFEMLKFRSMIDAVDDNGEPLPDEERITAFGAKLRRTSLDELPELINVLRGDMSLVGPRPLLMQYLPSTARPSFVVTRSGRG